MKRLLILLALTAVIAAVVAGWTWDDDGATAVACGSTIIACG